MSTASLFSSQLYTTPESRLQIMPRESVMFVLLLEGFEYFRIINQHNNTQTANCNAPSLLLVTWPLAAKFKALSNRKNWAILCRIPMLKFNPAENLFHYQSNGNDLTFSGIRELSAGEIELFIRDFANINSYLSHGTANTLFAAQATLMHLLGELISSGDGHIIKSTPQQQAAWQYKQLIDQDRSFRFSLTKLARQCNYSFGHLRKLFEEYYQTTPVKYRAKLRLARIEELLVHSNLSPKEIADAVGMNHVTHLYAFLKAHHQLPPGKNPQRR